MYRVYRISLDVVLRDSVLTNQAPLLKVPLLNQK